MSLINKNKKRYSISLVIPTRNNGKTIENQLKNSIEVIEKFKLEYEIIISNDSSQDNTWEILNKFKSKKIKIYNQKNRLGIAKNIRFLYKKSIYENVILFSVDGDWNPLDIGTLIKHAFSKNVDIVIGKRKMEYFSLKRKIVSRIYNFLPLFFFGVKTIDAGSIKLIRKDVLNNVNFQLDSVSFEAELLIKAAKKGFIIDWVPISYIKSIKNTNSSVGWQIILNSFFDILKLRINFKNE